MPGWPTCSGRPLVGAWPISRERIHAYAEKAMREGGEHTAWTDPMRTSRAGCTPHSMRRTTTTTSPRVVEAIVARIEPAGRSNALAAKLLALTLPGVPDVYQGTELGDLSLVDPDNRRPVDFDAAAAVPRSTAPTRSSRSPPRR